jgi:hypothetical protein
MQMITKRALENLQAFILQPDGYHSSMMVTIPSLHDVLGYEAQNNGGKYSTTVLGVCRWLSDRAVLVLKRLAVHSAPPLIQEPIWKPPDWRKVSIRCCDRNRMLIARIMTDWKLLWYATDPSPAKIS